MIICGIELKSNNLIFSLIDTQNQNRYLPIKEKKFTLNDDESSQELETFFKETKNLILKYDIEKVVLKKRAKKGNFAGGAVTFKMEGVVQLNGICPVEFISAQALSNFLKKTDIEFPKSLNKYQEQSYLCALAYSAAI